MPNHIPSGLALSCPLQVLQAKHKYQNLHKQQKKTFTTLTLLLNLQTTKEGHQQQNKSNTLKTTIYLRWCNSVVAIYKHS
jgi:hypothetical protein